ncbi:FAD-dependent oxidoreductase [Cellulomonas sp. H30R-01]|uniref:NAD(P)/FAD-dependent oxidoreductase n=1 Tax=Cellulomonas sp. H30R-01 TaxID=2704467 RepID=UPI00138BF14F|nr:FAD-dependent oxidoreductase [Cellulomonas sp. H30R-01]QHT56654.1 FAD-dependent oxidoreductase [Cellulomonas sp. H30R-01]
MTQDRYDVVVVGAGATGSATAWALARRGHRVLLLDRAQEPPVQGRDVVRPGHADVARCRLALLSHQWWNVLEHEAGERLVEPTGCVEHGPVEALRPLVETLLVTSVPFEYLTGPEAEQRWPGMRFDDRAVVQPAAGVADVAATLAALRRQAVSHGADLVLGADVRRVEVRDDAARVHVDDGDHVDASVVVVCAGAATAGLLGGVVEVPAAHVVRETRVRADRVEALPSGIRPWPAFVHRADPVAHRSARGDLGPDVGYPALRVRGEPTDQGVVLVHRTEPAPLGATGADAAPEAVATELVEYVAQCLPGVGVDDAGPWVTERAAGPMVLDRVGRVVLALGTGLHGVALAPGAGQVLADLAEDGLGVPRQVGADDDELDRSRFSLAALGAGV